MRAARNTCLAMSALLLLSSVLSAAPAWMPEYETTGRLVNTSAGKSSQRPRFTEKLADRMPDLEDEPKVGRSVAPRKILVGHRPPALTNSRVGRRVRMHEDFAGELTDLEDNPKVGRAVAVERKRVGHRVNVTFTTSSQLPTPKND